MTDSSQEVEVTVEGVVTRLVPCPVHAEAAPGEPVIEGDRCVQNANGYHHDCPMCAATTPMQENLERTVTRHVL